MTIAFPGDFSKPRPALIVQSDRFAETGTITVLLISGTLDDAPLLRVTVQPTPANGFRKASQVVIDKAMSVKRERIGSVFGRLDDETMVAINRGLFVFFGLG